MLASLSEEFTLCSKNHCHHLIGDPLTGLMENAINPVHNLSLLLLLFLRQGITLCSCRGSPSVQQQTLKTAFFLKTGHKLVFIPAISQLEPARAVVMWQFQRAAFPKGDVCWRKRGVFINISIFRPHRVHILLWTLVFLFFCQTSIRWSPLHGWRYRTSYTHISSNLSFEWTISDKHAHL